MTERREVWIALSDLWLDTEQTEWMLRGTARQLAETGLSWKEIEEIAVVDVAPVLHWNAWTVAGVWDAFDPDWLEAEIEKRRRRRGHALLARAFSRLTMSAVRHNLRIVERYFKEAVGTRIDC